LTEVCRFTRVGLGRGVRVHYVCHMAYQTLATINKGNARIKRDFAKPSQIRPASTAYTVMLANVAIVNAPHELSVKSPLDRPEQPIAAYRCAAVQTASAM